MAYTDYLPTSALIALPYFDYNGSVYRQEIYNPYTLATELLYSTKNYRNASFEYGAATDLGGGSWSFSATGTLSYTSHDSDDGLDFDDYYSGSITINTGDILVFKRVGLRFRYTGTSQIIFSRALNNDYYDLNPLLLDDNGNRKNSNIWTSFGYTNLFNVINGSHSTKLEITESKAGGSLAYLRKRIVARDSGVEDLIFWGGFDAQAIYVEIKDSLDESVPLETFVVDASIRESFSLIIKEHPSASEDTIFYIYLIGRNINGVSLSSAVECLEVETSSSLFIATNIVKIGKTERPFNTNRSSEFRTVLSNNVEKTQTTKSYDKFSGTVFVESDDLQKVKYALAKATQGDYVFHAGAADDNGNAIEKYDQEVFLGRISYNTPLEHETGYKIKINGQSLAYAVENPLIAPDSTNGVPV